MIWLVVWTRLKNISQLGWLFPIYWENKSHVPNHQPVMFAGYIPLLWQPNIPGLPLCRQCRSQRSGPAKVTEVPGKPRWFRYIDNYLLYIYATWFYIVFIVLLLFLLLITLRLENKYLPIAFLNSLCISVYVTSEPKAHMNIFIVFSVTIFCWLFDDSHSQHETPKTGLLIESVYSI